MLKAFFPIFLLIFNPIFSICPSCKWEIKSGKPHSIALNSLEQAVKEGLDCPPGPSIIGFYNLLSFFSDCESYSCYRCRFDTLFIYAKDDFEGFLGHLNEDIQELKRELFSRKNPDTQCSHSLEKRIQEKSQTLSKYRAKYSVVQSTLRQGLSAVQNECEKVYSDCITDHKDIASFYERSLIFYDQGLFLEVIEDLSSFIEKGGTTSDTSKSYEIEGVSFSNIGLYNQAVDALSKAIQEDPLNKNALLERAAAYFELGNLEKSLQDFLVSEYQVSPIDTSLLDFAKGFLSGARSGLYEGTTDIIPSLVTTAKGLSCALWSFTITPHQFSKDFASSIIEVTEYLKTHSTPEILETISPRLKKLIFDSHSLSRLEKGEILGHLIAQNGIEFLAIGGAFKAFQKVRKANMVMTLDTLAANPVKMTTQVENWGSKHLSTIEKMRIDENVVKSLRSKNMPELAIRKTLHNLGYETFPRPKGMPTNYKANFSKKNCGMVYIDPTNPHNYVRVMPADLNSPNVWHHRPYIQWVRNGKCLDVEGKILDSKVLEEAHIKIQDFYFKVN